MAKMRHHAILDYLRRILGEASGSGISDADLLRRFVDHRDEAAFELLLWRHAALVLHVCRQVLGDADAADDAFQATFLVFVRKAGSISRREALGSWLYRVAYRIALKARARVKTRSVPSEELDRLAAPAESEDAEQRELRRIVCEEVNRLPANYRAVVVACFFEGKTHEEAAKQLGWPRGTVAGRLARARELLHRRLLRRGVSLPMGAIVTALAVRTAQAALTGLVDSVIHTARLVTAGQAAAAVVSPHVAALAKGALQAMYWTKTKIAVIVLFLGSVGGTGVSLLATQEQKQQVTPNGATPAALPQPGQPPVMELVQARAPQTSKSDDEDEPAEVPAAEENPPQDAAKLAHDMARSRLNLKKLALAMQNYADTHHGHLPNAATVGKDEKALLSWRVALLPFLEQQALYNQFKLDEPWDSPHNRKLLSKMPAVYAPPGVKTLRPYSTFYQVFVSAGTFGRGEMPRVTERTEGLLEYIVPAFVKGQAKHFPADFPDGAAKTILIIEAGNPVPWTKPEDLHYAGDEPLPELGGLFPNVFHAAFFDGSVHTLTKNYNKKQLRYAITTNDDMSLDFSKIEAHPRPRGGTAGDRSTFEVWQGKNKKLRKELELTREQIQLLKEEQQVERELAGEDPRVNQLKDEHARMQAELKKLRAEIEAMKKDVRQPRKP